MREARMRRIAIAAIFTGFALVSGRALAANEATLAPSGGLGALTVTLAADGKTIRAGSQSIAAPEHFSPVADDVSVETISIGQHRSVVHVRVQGEADGTAWEAIIAPSANGSPNVMFSGITGYSRGEDG